MRNYATLAALAAALAIPAMLIAQGLPDNALDGPMLWSDPAPAAYAIRAHGTGLCATRAGGPLRTQLPHLVLNPCGTGVSDQTIELVPNGTTDDPLPQASPVTWRIMVRQDCLTAARGVLFGAPAIDQIVCERRNGEFRDSRGGAVDQTWRLRRRGPGDRFEVRSLDNRCWSAQGGELRAGVQLVMEPCDDRPGQHFEFTSVLFNNLQGDINGENNQTAAESFGWILLPAPNSSTPRRFRSMRRLNFPSGDYTRGMETANDQGLACAQACAEDAQCLGYTWVDPRARDGRPMCYKKDVLNQPVDDILTNSGIVRPR